MGSFLTRQITKVSGIVVLTAGLTFAGCRGNGNGNANAVNGIPAGWTASNMKPIGYSDLDGRGGAFKMAIRHVDGHWYLYMGHLWSRGWSIVDVTDPTKPTVSKFIPGPENTWTIQMELHDNLMVTSVGSFSKAWGADPNKPPAKEGALFWDISDPLNPKLLSNWRAGTPAGTHRDGYPGGKYAYMSAAMPGYKSNILVILDVSDPAHPKEVGRWWLPGQKDGEQPTNPSAMSYFFHGPPIISDDGNTAYLGYGPEVLILDIHDKTNPKEIGHLTISPPFGVGGLPVHDVKPIPGRDLLFAHSEALGNDSPATKTCDPSLSFIGLIDIKDPAKP